VKKLVLIIAIVMAFYTVAWAGCKLDATTVDATTAAHCDNQLFIRS
jgi:hypothetical protein